MIIRVKKSHLKKDDDNNNNENDGTIKVMTSLVATVLRLSSSLS